VHDAAGLTMVDVNAHPPFVRRPARPGSAPPRRRQYAFEADHGGLEKSPPVHGRRSSADSVPLPGCGLDNHGVAIRPLRCSPPPANCAVMGRRRRHPSSLI
jgi:hypothetical protein